MENKNYTVLSDEELQKIDGGLRKGKTGTGLATAMVKGGAMGAVTGAFGGPVGAIMGAWGGIVGGAIKYSI